MRYDLHCHTKYSRCSNIQPIELLKKAYEKKLDGIAVCDHNTMKGAFEAKKLNKNPKFEVILAEEITTDKGEVLGLFLKQEIKPSNFEKVVEEIRKQKGISIIAHPFSTGISRKKAKIDFRTVDCIEAFNARAIFNENTRAQRIADKLNITKTAGSDAHFIWEIGNAYTVFEGNLRDALKSGKTNIKGKNTLALFNRVWSFLKWTLKF